MDALRQTPGVTGAAFANQLPPGIGCGGGANISLEGRPADAAAERACVIVSHTGLLSDHADPAPGRPAAERGRRPAVAWKRPAGDRRDIALPSVINEAAARAYWADRNPIGASARFSGPDGYRLEVVGVVGDTFATTA